MRKIEIGKRIIVIGSPGSGKSTFSLQLAEFTGLKLIHLDKEERERKAATKKIIM